MKRHFWIFIIALLLGSIVNLVVAWVVAIYNPAMHEPIMSSDKEIMFTQGRVVFSYSIGESRTAKIYQLMWVGYAFKHLTREDATSAGLPSWAALNSEYDGVKGDPLAIRYEATGWPMISFASSTFQPIAPNPKPHVVGGIELDFLPRSTTDGLMMSTTLPTQPILPGLIVNTLVYSFAAWFMLAAPFIARRALRSRRRQCQGCGYPVGTSEVCTECGQLVLDKAETSK